MRRVQAPGRRTGPFADLFRHRDTSSRPLPRLTRRPGQRLPVIPRERHWIDRPQLRHPGTEHPDRVRPHDALSDHRRRHRRERLQQSRIRGSTPSTIEAAGRRSYLGAASDAIAPHGVLERSSTRTIILIGKPSAQCSRRISAQSSTPLRLLWLNMQGRVDGQGVKVQMPPRGQDSRAADTAGCLRATRRAIRH
jgi:hypothetical protein